MRWDDYKFFTAVAQAGSVRAAARDLGVHASTVSRRLEHFEARLGTALFHRTERRLTLTADGEAVVVQARAVAARLEEMEARLQGASSGGGEPLRMEVPDALLLSAPIQELFGRCDAASGLGLVLVPASQGAQVSREQLDVALRFTDMPDLDLIGQSLGRLAMACYSNSTASDAFIGWQGADGGDADLAEALRLRDFADLPVRHRAGSVVALRAALLGGLGVAALPCILGDTLPGVLRVGGEPMLGAPLWSLAHPALRGDARVQQLQGWLRDIFSARVDLLEGRVTIHP